MKKVIFGFFLISFLKGISQNPYDLFNSKSEMFFGVPNAATGSTVLLIGLKPDSVKVNGADSVYYHYRIIETTTNLSCYNARGVNWTGKNSIRKSDGDYIFFNKQNDTIYIKPQLGVGSSWRFYTFPGNSNYITATISQKTFSPTYAQLSDTVKIITFQAFNNLNQPIYHYYNTQQFIISKQQGVIKWGKFYNFPTDTTLTQRYNGKRLKRFDIYDYEVGDEFHLRNYFWFGNNPMPGSWDATKITSKNVISIDSVCYGALTQYVSSYGQINPVTTTSLNYGQLSQYISPLMPWQTPLYNNDYDFNNYKIINYNTNCQSIVLGNESLYPPHWGILGDSYMTIYPVTPLSALYYCMQNVTQNLTYTGPNNIILNWESVVYRMRNNLPCGVTDMEMGLPELENKMDVEIFPIPANDVLTIRGTGINFNNKLKLNVYDSQGKNIMNKGVNLESAETKVDIFNFPKGLYLLSFINDEGKTVYSKRIIKQ